MNSMYNALNTLYSRAHKQMTADELGDIEVAFLEGAVSIAQDASAVLEGIACLVASEEQAHNDGHSISGSLQTQDGIFKTLCLAASKFDLIAGMVEVGAEAKFHKTEMRNKEAAK